MNHEQPWLHELEICVDGPSTVLSDKLGNIRTPGTGWFFDDHRLLSHFELQLGGASGTWIASHSQGATTTTWGVARHLGDRAPDPTVDIRRMRTVSGDELVEQVVVRSRASQPVSTSLEMQLAGDAAELAQVKAGTANSVATLPATLNASGVEWASGRHRVEILFDAPPAALRTGPDGVTAEWQVDLAPGEEFTVQVTAQVSRIIKGRFDAASGHALCDFGSVRFVGDGSWQQLLAVNLDDLSRLLMRDPEFRSDVFAAAGTPWYLTLFGRDSLWTARFMLPFSPALAEGTLRALARRQALHDDPARDAEPGKILHEARGSRFVGGELSLPTSYYGSVDSTPLWVILLHDAHQWGMPLDVVRELLPNLRAAVNWMQHAVSSSQDGLLRYIDRTGGQGLSNQGWKDSGDSMRRADGSIAPAPIALIEAQAYAVEAANAAAALYEELGADGAAELRRWGVDLAQRVRERFWTSGDDPYLVMALDANGDQVDGVGSNMGHALGTGLLTADEETRVVDRLTRPDMLHQLGIVTLSSENPAYNPIGYHTGSIWVHDTAIVMLGMMRSGHRDAADRVLSALLRAATSVGFRFPELLAGDAVSGRAAPYPASCRPQAWSAASAAAMATVQFGLAPDGGRFTAEPSTQVPRSSQLQGVRYRGEGFDVAADKVLAV